MNIIDETQWTLNAKKTENNEFHLQMRLLSIEYTFKLRQR